MGGVKWFVEQEELFEVGEIRWVGGVKQMEEVKWFRSLGEWEELGGQEEFY